MIVIISRLVTVGDRSFASAGPKLWNRTVSLASSPGIGLIVVSIQKETENTLISAIISGRYFLVFYGFFFVAIVVLEVNCYVGHVKNVM